jgi:hypothetical protein
MYGEAGYVATRLFFLSVGIYLLAGWKKYYTTKYVLLMLLEIKHEICKKRKHKRAH